MFKHLGAQKRAISRALICITIHYTGDINLFFMQFFMFIEEIEWAIEMAAKTGLPVLATMAIGPQGDHNGVSCAECAVRMARAGAHVGKDELSMILNVSR